MYAFDCLVFSQVDEYILPAKRGKSRPSRFDLRYVQELRGTAHSMDSHDALYFVALILVDSASLLPGIT